MNPLSQGRLIEILCHMDPALLEEDFLEQDLEKQELTETVSKWSRKKIAVISGIAAGSIALTGMAVLAFRKKELFHRAA